jgi:Flp pilus assembly pilin Flp
MNKIKKIIKDLWQDESAQGATEYILLLVVVVTLAMIFRKRITAAFSTKVDEVDGGINGFQIEQQ